MCGRCFAYAAAADRGLHIQPDPGVPIQADELKRGHLLFDFDGTLTDPREGIVNCLRHAFTSLAFPAPSEDELSALIGPPLQESFLQIFGASRTDLAARALELYRERFRDVGMFENRVYPGIPVALERLVQSGWTLWVATSKPHLFARQIAQHFGLAEYFAGIHGAELDGIRSNKGDLIAHILETENIEPEQAIMIGDRSHDILGARRNGVRSIGVLWGYGSHDELAQAGADTIHDSIDSVVAHLISAGAPAHS